ncbi:uncharacterized protein LOC123550718 [Mercenaria mercenaria]|uniref:uncharacterized protein LOC123550718 n=1 Tax=Mercenaria mercenaria TaxID=6596 RepID=UPI00234ECB42|nr:uncharacterized protein LOC123550718 [Mercenaria mercenaria]
MGQVLYPVIPTSPDSGTFKSRIDSLHFGKTLWCIDHVIRDSPFCMNRAHLLIIRLGVTEQFYYRYTADFAMDISNRLELRILALLTLIGYILTFPQDFDRTPSTTDPSSHETNENEVVIALWDGKWFVVLVVSICILITLGLLCFLVWRWLCEHRQRTGERTQPIIRPNAIPPDRHPILGEGDLNQGQDTYNRIGNNSSEELALNVGNSDDETETEIERENRPLVDIRNPAGHVEFSRKNVSLPNEQIQGQAEELIDENDPVITDRKIPVVLEFRDADELNACKWQHIQRTPGEAAS